MRKSSESNRIFQNCYKVVANCNLAVIRGAGDNFSQKNGPGKLSTGSGSLQPAPIESRMVWYREHRQPVV
jgi:hypothetical protein